MAEENEDGQEKTEEPTQQRLQKAIEDGKLLTSKEVMVFTTLAMGLLLFMGLSPFFGIGNTSPSSIHCSPATQFNKVSRIWGAYRDV